MKKNPILDLHREAKPKKLRSWLLFSMLGQTMKIQKKLIEGKKFSSFIQTHGSQVSQFCLQ